MSLDVNIKGPSTGTALVDADGRLHVVLAEAAAAEQNGSVSIFTENDPGDVTGTRLIRSPEADVDYRLRVAFENQLEDEVFNYVAQNTNKYAYHNATMGATWTQGGLLTNNGSITTVSTGVVLRSYQAFPIIDPGMLAINWCLSMSAAQAPANTICDVGLFFQSGTNPYTPTDGVYFRFNSSGIIGVVNHNGTEVTTSALAFTPTANEVYSFVIYCSDRRAEFWINNVLYGAIDCPAAQGQLFISDALNWGLRHVISGGAAGAVFQLTARSVSIAASGANYADNLGTQQQRIVGAYQGLSGGTLGQLANYTNSADPAAAAALSNTAALVTGLGGQFRFNAAATAVTDGIVVSYQNPVMAVTTRNRRLKIVGIKIDCVNVGAAVATTATTLQWCVAFGHTAVSLATTEAATTKAPRRVPLGIMTWPVGAAIGQQPQFGPIQMDFRDAPIYVDPGHFVALVAKFIVGTATASQVIWGTGTFIYSWE